MNKNDPKTAKWSRDITYNDHYFKIDVAIEDSGEHSVDLKTYSESRPRWPAKLSKSEQETEEAYYAVSAAVDAVKEAYDVFQATYKMNADGELLTYQKMWSFTTPIQETGITVLSIEKVQNQYHNNASGRAYGILSPWFRITTKVGVFLVGWRKRVRHVEIEKLFVEPVQLFEGRHYSQYHGQEDGREIYHVETDEQYRSFFRALSDSQLDLMLRSKNK